MSERLQEVGDGGRRGTRVIMLPSDKTRYMGVVLNVTKSGAA